MLREVHPDLALYIADNIRIDIVDCGYVPVQRPDLEKMRHIDTSAGQENIADCEAVIHQMVSRGEVCVVVFLGKPVAYFSKHILAGAPLHPDFHPSRYVKPTYKPDGIEVAMSRNGRRQFQHEVILGDFE